ncbi:MAG: cation diffusion facilitator family transporter [Arenimonas sp.]
MGQGHDHRLGNIHHEKPLRWALLLTGGFLVAELVGAWLTNSLALLSDAAHMATDTLALVIALVAVRLGRRPADAKRTFGYVRLEAFGALANGVLLFVVAGFILWESIGRVRAPPPVETGGMLVIAAIGLVVNLVAMRLLKAGSGESLNMKAAYLEVWSDMLGSAAVLVGAVVIRFTGWAVIDPVLAVVLGLWVLPRTWTLVNEAVHVLMEGVPKGIDLASVRGAIEAAPGVASVHDLHVWSLSSARPALAAHVLVADGGGDPVVVRTGIASMLQARFDLHHVTLQMETEACEGVHCGEAHGGHGEAEPAAQEHDRDHHGDHAH